MEFKEFKIEFTYDAIYYSGVVQPFDDGPDMLYHVTLENENQENSLDIILRPSRSPTDDWEFECPGGGLATDRFDKDLLIEIGEQVEAILIADSTADPS